MKPNEITHEIIGAAIEVHRELGPGKSEAIYESALVHELALRRIPHKAQRPVPVVYKGVKLDCGYRLDALVCDTVVVEAKAVEAMHPIFRAQTLTYLKLGGWKLALLLNFNVAVLKEGIERLVLGLGEQDKDTLAPDTVETGFIEPDTVPAMHAERDCGDAIAERLASKICGAAAEVHHELGPGLLPSAYDACLCHELTLRGIPFERKRPLTLSYKGKLLPELDQVQILVSEKVVINSHALFELQPVHQATLLSQLRLGGWKLGLLLNFNSFALKEGIKRVVLS